MVVLLYFDETQNVNANEMTSPGFTLHFAFRQSKATDLMILKGKKNHHLKSKEKSRSTIRLHVISILQ